MAVLKREDRDLLDPKSEVSFPNHSKLKQQLHTMTIDCKVLKSQNQARLIAKMPVELWREVDDWLDDAESHTLLRASCSFFRTWLPMEKEVEFAEFKRLAESVNERGFADKGRSFQKAVHLNPRTVIQEHYDYLCGMDLTEEVFRICRLALVEPFTCSQIDVSACYDHAIIFASIYGETSLVALLLQHSKVNPAARDNWAVFWASKKGHSDIVELLLQDPRVDPSAQDNEAIRKAAEKGYTSVVTLLLQDPRVDPSARDNEALHLASSESKRSKSHEDVCKLLLTDNRVVAAYLLNPDFDISAGIYTLKPCRSMKFAFRVQVDG